MSRNKCSIVIGWSVSSPLTSTAFSALFTRESKFQLVLFKGNLWSRLTFCALPKSAFFLCGFLNHLKCHWPYSLEKMNSPLTLNARPSLKANKHNIFLSLWLCKDCKRQMMLKADETVLRCLMEIKPHPTSCNTDRATRWPCEGNMVDPALLDKISSTYWIPSHVHLVFSNQLTAL